MQSLHLPDVSGLIDFNFNEAIELQELVELAAAVCQTPVAIISLIDENTQYFKVKIGLTETWVPRKTSFCDHTIKQTGVFVVPDAFKNAMFAANPMVNTKKPVRFYAGAPLLSSTGNILGSICVMGYKVHTITGEQARMLKLLACQTAKALELMVKLNGITKAQLEIDAHKEFINDANIRLRSFFESSTNFQVLLGKAGEVIDFNKTAYMFVKHVHKAEMKKGDMFVTYIAPSFVSIFIDRYHQALTGITAVEEGSTAYKEKGIIWWDASFEPARNLNNEIIGVSYIIRDVSERKLKEKKILDQNQSLLKIAHIQAHEFRAPLTTIMGLMSLIKSENDRQPIPYMEYLEQAAINLDAKIKGLVNNIEEGVIR